MPSGNKNAGKEIGIHTRFTSENAAEYGRRGNATRRKNIPLRKCLKNIATEALYGHPDLPEAQLKPIAKFFKIPVKEVTFAELAIYRQAIQMAKGDRAALDLIAGYAGEKAEVTTEDPVTVIIDV
jgi:hypothetical protein